VLAQDLKEDATTKPPPVKRLLARLKAMVQALIRPIALESCS
jgi:hypothetical protein